MAGAGISNNKMISLLEMAFGDIFPEIVEEEVRLKGGHYCREYIPIEDMLVVTPDMEGAIDARRTPEPAEEIEEQERGEWYHFRPKPHELTPFYATMAMSENDDFGHPSFSSTLLGKAQVKITYHRGGRMVLQRKGASPDF